MKHSRCADSSTGSERRSSPVSGHARWQLQPIPHRPRRAGGAPSDVAVGSCRRLLHRDVGSIVRHRLDSEHSKTTLRPPESDHEAKSLAAQPAAIAFSVIALGAWTLGSSPSPGRAAQPRLSLCAGSASLRSRRPSNVAGFALGFTGAAWSLSTGNPVPAGLAALRAALRLPPSRPTGSAYSYFFRAHRQRG